MEDDVHCPNCGGGDDLQWVQSNNTEGYWRCRECGQSFTEGYDPDDEFDCGWSHTTGGCSMAGTETCDFDCPHRKQLGRVDRLFIEKLRAAEGSDHLWVVKYDRERHNGG